MKYFLSLSFLLVLGTACKEKQLTKADVENKLMQTMHDFLVKTVNPGVTVTVKDVSFFPEKNAYTCEFHVNMHSADKDTTGVMTAYITKDFNSVKRIQ